MRTEEISEGCVYLGGKSLQLRYVEHVGTETEVPGAGVLWFGYDPVLGKTIETCAAVKLSSFARWACKRFNLYAFASLRGGDFQVHGTSPEDAWQYLCNREEENGVLWRTRDKYRNRAAVERQGFTELFKNSAFDGPVYRVLSRP